MIVVEHGKEAEIAHDLRRQELTDKAFILKVAHGEMQRFQPVRTGDIGEPVLILFRGRLTDALDVLEHGEAQRVGVNPAVPRTVVRRLEHYVGMAVEKLQHKALSHFPFIVEMVEDGVVPEGGPPLVHHLGLFLRVEILADFTHDAQDLALPRFEQRGVLLHKVQQVLLRFGRVATSRFNRFFLFALRQGAPQHIHLALQILFPAFLPRFLLLQRDFLRTFIAVDAVVHQRVAGVEQFLYFVDAIALFALGDVLTGKDQIVDDRAGVGPAAKQIVIFKKRVMPVAGMGHHQRLHGDGVFLHQVGDTGVGVDDYLIRQTLLTVLIGLLGLNKFFAKRPVRIVDGHADAGVGVHHLLGSNDFDLVRVGVKTIELGDPVHFGQVGFQ